MTTSEHIIGKVNDENGICGFAASVYMASKIDPTCMPTSVGANLARRTLVEIANFLQTLKSKDIQLFQDIENFTKSFGKKYKNFTNDEYIALCNFAVNVTENHIIEGGGYDIAMSPNAVAAYLKHAWDIDAQALPITSGQGGTGNCILGLCAKGKGMYGGLQHWVYRHNGVIYSWGETYSDLAAVNGEAGGSWEVGWIVC